MSIHAEGKANSDVGRVFVLNDPPAGKIVDLKTDITGLTLKDLKPIKTTLEDVQADLLKLVGPEVILVGHG